MKKLILIISLMLLSSKAMACSYHTKLNLKTSRATWNGDGAFTCGDNTCYQENLKYTYWKPVNENKLRLPKFRFSEDIPKPIRDLVLLKIEKDLLGLPEGVLENEIVENEAAFATGVDDWFNFGVIYPNDTPYFRALLAYANLQKDNFRLDEDKNMYEILGGNLRLVSFFLDSEDLTVDAKANVLVHEFLHYFLNHSQGDTVKFDYLYEGSKKRQWVIGKIGESVPIMYPTPALGKAKIMQEDVAQFREAIGFPQDKDTTTVSGVVTWNSVLVKAARLTFINLDTPDWTRNVEIDGLRAGDGSFTVYGLKKGTYEIRLEAVNPMFADLTAWNKFKDKPVDMPTAVYFKNKKGKKIKFVSDVDKNINLDFGSVEL